MKRLFSVVLACLLAGAIFLLVRRTHDTSSAGQQDVSNQENTTQKTAPSEAGAPSRTSPTNPSPSIVGAALQPAPSTQPQDLSARAGERPPDTNAEINLPPEVVLQNVRRAVHQFGDMFGGNPVGTNPEITEQLTGKNPKQINFLTGQPGMRVNQDGALVDAWGTPYFFHQISGTEMEIHSAGPDKVMWTSDDLVVK